MSKQLNSEVYNVDYDELVNSATPATDVFSVTVAALAEKVTLKRGTVLARSAKTGKMSVLGTKAASGDTLTANCVLSDDVEAGTADTPTFAYRTGHFNSNKLIVADEYTLTADDKEELRKCGILLSDAVAI